jgi:hypothetical protein
MPAVVNVWGRRHAAARFCNFLALFVIAHCSPILEICAAASRVIAARMAEELPFSPAAALKHGNYLLTQILGKPVRRALSASGALTLPTK